MAAWLLRSSRSLRRTFSAAVPRRDERYSTREAEAKIRDWITRMTDASSLQDQVDVLDSHRLQMLELTLPSLSDEASEIPDPPAPNTPVLPGTELVLFPPLVRTSRLLPNGTDDTYSAPPPFVRRMWAGGEMAYDPSNALLAGQRITCSTAIEDVQLKGWEKARETDVLESDAMVFVRQRKVISNNGGPAIVERRTHVYRCELSEPQAVKTAGTRKPIMHTEQHPPDKQFIFTPSAHTLFRFSALMFNAHSIHLDPIYSQTEGHEGWLLLRRVIASEFAIASPDRLVHGPMTSLLLLRFAHFLAPPDTNVAAFKYRATHPLIVDRPLTLNLRWLDGRKGAEVWATSDKGVVGMKGTVVFADK